MSRVPDEPKHWPTDGDGEAALRDLRLQVENARHRLSQQWGQMEASDAPNTDSGGDQTSA